MRKPLVLAALATAIFASNANATWQVYYNTSTGKLVGSYVTNNTQSGISEEASRPSGTVNTTIEAAGVYINPADTTNSWVQFDFNVNTTNRTRNLIVFRNPLSQRVAPILKEFKDQMMLGRKLTFMENYGNTSPTLITNNWMNWASQISYDINPGDNVYFTFK